jgi:hypothetical protein
MPPKSSAATPSPAEQQIGLQKHERAQRTLQELDFNDLRSIMQRTNMAPLQADQVDWVVERATLQQRIALQNQNSPLPSYVYIVQELVKVVGNSSQTLERFFNRLRNDVYHDLARNEVPPPSMPQPQPNNPFAQFSAVEKPVIPSSTAFLPSGSSSRREG